MRATKASNQQTTKGNAMKTTTVIGRNGYEYGAQNISGDLFIVGKFIVKVEDGKVEDTICRATKANIKRLAE